ncbi:MAG TPA: anthranilate synthase component I family protein [Aridibacter sp.]|nr:anthranilate synthase component I family protein [Aridibacter sp.]
MDAAATEQIDELSAHFGKADLVPVITRLPGDFLTPVAAYCAIAGRSRRSFLFESVEGGEHLARYSFIGSDPEFSVRETEEGLSVSAGSTVEHVKGSVLEFLRSRLPKKRVAPIEDLPSFLGGAVGFLDYAVSRQIEPVLSKDGRGRSVACGSEFMFFRHIVAFDHVRQTINIVSLVLADEPGSDPERFREEIAEALEQNRATAERLAGLSPATAKNGPCAPKPVSFKSNFSRKDFEASVERIKDLISAGECYQVVLSQCFSRATSASPIEIFRALRSLNPSPYMFLMDFGERAVIGASPEMLVRCRGRRLDYRPIAGTRPRGTSPEEDAILAAEMLADGKELAEHRMLVDLGRNDLGRVAEFGSVKIDDLMSVEKFSHVQHIVSAISARLKPELDGFDALAACFPAGTVTGAPKVRAMQIISELEPTERGVYSGAVGYFDHQGNVDTCIAIRTVHLEGGVAKVQAGAGIVADSVASNEFEETVHKAAALMRAIELAESGVF